MVETSALTPLVEGIIGKDMVRFKDFAMQYVANGGGKAAAPQASQAVASNQ
ncbi:hypothetical protein HaLaN_28359 [Haematococcus lacustris]|uniref:Uncharacterized protein n=1 Tax=Haematococcus lacustris TaxID=44745 RepID=A0A6A0ABH3_HAELA|nr:hypothetical protein HaLaN_28359 [Haematococcus lacustris]